MNSKTIEEQINDLKELMENKDEPKCIDMLKELANMEEFDVNALYLKYKYIDINISLLHKSCEYNLLEVFKYLIDYLKADVYKQNDHGNTALHFASFHGHFDIVRYLIDNATNIDVNIQNEYGYTALHCASWEGNVEIVRCLIENTNIDVNIRSVNGSTALHVACDWKKREVVLELLKCNRIDVLIKNFDNQTAEQVARSKEYHDIAELIANYEPHIDILNNK